jgi:hypothetical protein
MKTNSKGASKRPTCGRLSIIFALIGFAFEATEMHRISGVPLEWWVAENVNFPVFVLYLAGMGLSIGGMVRRERMPWLSYVGLGLNFILLATVGPIGF